MSHHSRNREAGIEVILGFGLQVAAPVVGGRNGRREVSSQVLFSKSSLRREATCSSSTRSSGLAAASSDFGGWVSHKLVITHSLNAAPRRTDNQMWTMKMRLGAIPENQTGGRG